MPATWVVLVTPIVSSCVCCVKLGGRGGVVGAVDARNMLLKGSRFFFLSPSAKTGCVWRAGETWDGSRTTSADGGNGGPTLTGKARLIKSG